MARIIDDLRDLTRIDRGEGELRRERVDLREVVASAVESSGASEGAGHGVAVSLPPEPLHVDADARRFAHALGTLLEHAAVRPRAGRPLTLSGTRDERHAVVGLADSGAAIPQDALRRVFEPLVIDEDAGRMHGELGIALTVLRRLTEMHGGTVDVETGPRGSTVTIRLPLAPGEDAAAGAPRPAADGPAPLRVLVVDDNEDSVSMLSMLIELKGHVTATAESGQEALEITEAFQPDVVVLDIGLPGMDGYEVARRLRARPGGDQLLLVALTGWGSEDDKQRTREAGFDRHFTKPVEPDALEQLLLEAVGRRR